MNLLDAFRKCSICRKKRKKDCAQVVIEAVDGNKTIKICDECEKILILSDKAAHRKADEDVEQI
jgi:hypothetical protein